MQTTINLIMISYCTARKTATNWNEMWRLVCLFYWRGEWMNINCWPKKIFPLQTRLKSACQMWVRAMAQTPKKWGFEPWLGNFSEPWLKVLFFGGLSHGSKSNNWCVRAMAQSPIIDEFEPWLKVQQCSKSNNIGVWAIAQRLKIWGLGPRLKGNFVAIFEVIKALQFLCFFTLHIYSQHYRNINTSNSVIEFIEFVNLKICKNGKGHYFQIRFLWLL